MSPRPKGVSPNVSVPLPEEAKKVLQAIADEQYAENLSRGVKTRVYISDVVREAIAEYLQKRGHGVDVTVDRGGNRRGKPGQ